MIVIFHCDFQFDDENSVVTLNLWKFTFRAGVEEFVLLLLDDAENQIMEHEKELNSEPIISDRAETIKFNER